MSRRHAPAGVAIVAAGACTAVGASAASSCAALRAGLDRFVHTHFVDRSGQPLVGAGVPLALLGEADAAPGERLGGAPKLAAMLVRALSECLRAGGAFEPARTALLVVGPEATRPGASLLRHEDSTTEAIETLGLNFHASSRVFDGAGTGFVAALRGAQQLLARGVGTAPVDQVLVAGVDSLLNGDDINHGVAHGRLLADDNADGFIPGEAAACVLLRPAPRGTDGDAADAVLDVIGLGDADEPDSWHSERANSGRGLAAAIRQALATARLEPHAVHQRLADGAGESFFMDESVYAWGRVLRALSPGGYSAPLIAASVGCTGAAAGPLMATLCLDMARKGWGGGEHSLLHFSSTGAERAAAVLRARRPHRPQAVPA
jgi:3-oxoacyl-[acyl-carrier-protein] synthase I